MKRKTFSKDKFSIYCREHLEEFRVQLRDEANKALTSWPGRTAVILFILSSLITYGDALSRDNPFAIYTLFSYVLPIGIVAFYPLATLIFSTIGKYSSVAMDLLCITGLFAFCFNLMLIFAGANSEKDLLEIHQILQGQVIFAFALATAFAFHTSIWFTLARNILFTMSGSIGIYIANADFFVDNRLSILEGLLIGIMINWVFHDGIRTRFYLKSTDADTRQHLYNQLSKLVYSHQLERIKLGDELENTMPLKEGKAIINVFDVQRSSEIRHEKTQEFFMGVFQAFLEICMQGYEHNPLRSRAFRLKETGDGFISSIGYPFLPVDSRSLADSAVSTALLMFEAFNLEVAKFNYSRPIKGSMGLAYNSVQGTFQSGGIRSYDLFGDALIQASKYEELRKQPLLWDLFTKHAKRMGLDHFHVLVVQEMVYNSLSPSYRDLFSEVEINTPNLIENNFQMMYDNDAKYIYYHLLE